MRERSPLAARAVRGSMAPGPVHERCRNRVPELNLSNGSGARRKERQQRDSPAARLCRDARQWHFAAARAATNPLKRSFLSLASRLQLPPRDRPRTASRHDPRRSRFRRGGSAVRECGRRGPESGRGPGLRSAQRIVSGTAAGLFEGRRGAEEGHGEEGRRFVSRACRRGVAPVGPSAARAGGSERLDGNPAGVSGSGRSGGRRGDAGFGRRAGE